MMSDVSGTTGRSLAARSLMATPLSIQNGPSLGAILVGYSVQSAFSRRQLELLNMLAGHMALVVNNAALTSELEYKTMLNERTRLAREIHDGLAQTLGFLKLQVAQLQNYLNRSEYDRLENGLHTSYNILSEAYLDVRDAIDGLRTNPVNDNIEIWLGDLLADFEEASGITTDAVAIEQLNNLSPEIQVQLIRIVQEALSNVRKHAHATRLEVRCVQTADELVLEIRDNGHGFTPGEVSIVAQYGLRGMRERAELIGADFQVISCPQEGTTIHVGIYVPSKEKTKDEQ
jgi:two-component system nitrate/nitrite sensor histidine kinase NarX